MRKIITLWAYSMNIHFLLVIKPNGSRVKASTEGPVLRAVYSSTLFMPSKDRLMYVCRYYKYIRTYVHLTCTLCVGVISHIVFFQRVNARAVINDPIICHIHPRPRRTKPLTPRSLPPPIRITWPLDVPTRFFHSTSHRRDADDCG